MKTALTTIEPRHFAVILLLGFSSGLPLALTGSTLQAWLSTGNVDIHTIGWLTLAGIPYTWKFLWSPFMDRFVLPYLGRRRGWMITCQLALMGVMVLLSQEGEHPDIAHLAILTPLLAFLSASQDIAIDAYRSELLSSRERGMGAALAVLGYRLAMLVSGALALIMAASLGWMMTWQIMAALMTLGVMACLWGQEPLQDPNNAPRTLRQSLVEPWREFLSRPSALWLLLLILLYKLGDAFAGALITHFLLKGAGFTLAQVGLVNKFVSLIATILGALLAGLLMLRWSLYRALLWFGILQGGAAVGYFWLAVDTPSLEIMALAVFVENFTAGMGTSAFSALLMGLCNPRFTATQFALLSALAAVGRIYVGPLAGHLVDILGWSGYFLFAMAAALPGIWLVWRLKTSIEALELKNG
jgi:PAT family beta-lactamase induction signal transducer AmpG